MLVTAVVAVKIYDGVVLAADSATTLMLPNGAAQVYNHANKVFQLHRTRPIAAATWGNGQINNASIATLAKDLRRRLMGRDDSHRSWELADGYTMEEVANRLVQLMYDELYSPLQQSGELGFVIAGFGDKADTSEIWEVTLADAAARPTPINSAAGGTSGLFGWAQGREPVGRLFTGISPMVRDALLSLVRPDQTQVAHDLLQIVSLNPAQPAMPLQDAVNLARFSVDVACGYQRYSLGPDTVGGAIDIAAVTRHEGFKWISRKHYYPPDLNMGSPHDHL